jgi:phosphotriesterase-related protein
MHRRTFLKSGIALAALASGSGAAEEGAMPLEVMTVLGPEPVTALGIVLPHEHVLVDFVGADQVSPDRYDPDVVFDAVRPHLEAASAAGVGTLVECTPSYLGKDPALLLRLSEATGLRLVTNTGYYNAAEGRFLPAHALEEDADALAARWLAEWRDGIGDTGILPGFIKIGVSGGPLTDTDQKLVRAAARVHLATGMTIASHTTHGGAAAGQVDLLGEEGVAPEAFIWVHAHTVDDPGLHEALARRGAWIEFDGLSPDSVAQHAAFLGNLRDRGFLGRCLASHDAGWYAVGEPDGGTFRGFDTLTGALIPALREAGWDGDDVDRLVKTNPGEAFALRVRAKA